jgi:hypothetical protein
VGLEELPLNPGECIVLVRYKGRVIGVQGIALEWEYTEDRDYVDVGDPYVRRRFLTEIRARLKLDMRALKVAVVDVNWDDLYDQPTVLPQPRLTEGTTDED